MIRNILITALFFFGPAILMFMLRRIFLFARIGWRLRSMQRSRPADVIDITPNQPTKPGTIFITASLLVGAVCAVLIWLQMSSDPEPSQKYIPAHVNEQGKLVPGRMAPVVPENRDQP